MKTFLKVVASLFLVLLLISTATSCKKKNLAPLIQNYKIFKNAVYSFQYPSDWILTENGTNVTVTGPQQDSYFVNIKVDFNDQIDMSLDEFVKTVENQNNLSGLPAYEDKGKINIDLPAGKAIQRSLTTNVNTAFSAEPVKLFVTLTYLVQDSKIGYVITTEVPNKVYQNYNEIFTNIKRSFRFMGTVKK
jgi:hypothetical protein